MKALFLFILSIITSGIIICQHEVPTSGKNTAYTLGGSIGVNDYHIKDEYLSPYIFGGGIFSSRISFGTKSERIRHNADILFSIGTINSDKQPRDVNQYGGFVSYSFFHSLDTWSIGARPLELFVGAGVSSFASFTEFIATDRVAGYRYYDQSWYWSNGLNLHVLGEYRFDENRSLSAQLTTPAMRLVARPENGHELNEKNKEIIGNFLNAATKGKSEFFWENLVLLTELEYREQLNDRIGFRGTYTFDYASSDKPLSMGMYWNNFLVGVFWIL